MIINWKSILSILAYISSMGTAYAETLQTLGSIEQTAYVYALGQVQSQYDNPQVIMGSLDTRLRLQACELPLEAFTNQRSVGLGNQTIGVKCKSSVPWTIYVPVTVKSFQPVLVAARSLSAKQIITESDVKMKSMDIGLLRQAHVKNAQLIIGQQLKYSIASGMTINPNSVRPQKVVRRGDLITLVVEVGTMKVRMSGTALSDASLGQRIRVKNSSSKRIVEGIVDGPGVVKVSL